MGAVIGFLAENGAMLVAGLTALLAAGCAAAGACRSPVHRQRVCEGAVAGALVWAVLACTPLPRFTPRVATTGDSRRETSVVEVREIPPDLMAPAREAGEASTPVPQESDVPNVATGTANVAVGARLARAFVGGMAACAAWLVIGQVMLWRLARRASTAPADVQAAVDDWAGGRRARVLVSAGVGGPVTWGAWRPVIVLPRDLLGEGRATQLRQVLLHEAGHVRQGDGWGNLLFCLALPVLYFHPLYWWLRRSGDLARELVVDDWAARVDGKDAYVTELVSLARARVGSGVGGPVGAIGMVRRRSHFYRRMRMLLQRSEPLATGCSKVWRTTMAGLAVALVAGSATLVGVRPAVAQAQASGQRPAAFTGVTVAAPNPPGLDPDEPPTDAKPREMERDELRAKLAKSEAEARMYRERLRSSEAAGPSRAAAPPPVTRPVPGAVSPTQRMLEGSPGAAPGVFGGGAGGVQLDLVNLANSLVDASGAYKQAKITFEQRQRLQKSGAFNEVEVAEARARLETAQKRVELLRAIAQAALETAKVNHARVKQLYQMGMEGADRYEELAGKVKVLELIVRGAE